MTGNTTPIPSCVDLVLSGSLLGGQQLWSTTFLVLFADCCTRLEELRLEILGNCARGGKKVVDDVLCCVGSLVGKRCPN